MGNEEDQRREKVTKPLSAQSDRSKESSELLTKKLHSEGVFRFRTFEEFNKWKERFRVDGITRDPT